MGFAARIVYQLLYKALAVMEGLPRGYYFRNLAAAAIALLAAIVVYEFTLIHSGTITRQTLEEIPRGDKMIRFLEKIHWMPKEEG